jgi:hypothetical protein
MNIIGLISDTLNLICTAALDAGVFCFTLYLAFQGLIWLLQALDRWLSRQVDEALGCRPSPPAPEPERFTPRQRQRPF